MQTRIEIVGNYIEKAALSQEIKQFYKSRSILVTGGAGAIGSNLIIALSSLVGEKGKVVVLDNLSSINCWITNETLSMAQNDRLFSNAPNGHGNPLFCKLNSRFRFPLFPGP